MSENLQKTIRDKFGVDEEELLRERIEDVEDWFLLSEERIKLSDTILSLSERYQYLTYLIAAKLAEKGDFKETEVVLHSEADNYFGWSRDDGNTARNYATYLSDILVQVGEDGGRKIPPANYSEAVDKVKEKLGDSDERV